MFYNCGNGYGIFMTTEEYFSLSDEEFDYIIKTQCYEYPDPFYSNKRNPFNVLNKIDSSNFDIDDDTKQSNLKLDEILSIIDSNQEDIFSGFINDIDDINDISELENLDENI